QRRQVPADCAAGAADAALAPPAVPPAPPDTPPSAPSRPLIEDEDRALTFEQIVQKYEKKIFNLILRRISDREEAEDLTQETFLNAFKSFPTFRGDCKIHTWLC